MYCLLLIFFFFFFNDTATTEIYTLSLHDALPIWRLILRGLRATRCRWSRPSPTRWKKTPRNGPCLTGDGGDRKSTRLNSSHGYISYAVFCLKKKKNGQGEDRTAWHQTSLFDHDDQ